MKLNKIKTFTLEKCYAVAPLEYQGGKHILVAAEKTDRCLLFDCLGNLEDTVWKGPGGTMSMVQAPGSDGCFLATHEFYSPNDSARARIVLVTPEDGKWKVETLWELPFVHRFDIVTKNGVSYLIACTLKSGHGCKDDWSSPGKIYVGRLPEDIRNYKDVELKPVCEGLLKNHGYCRIQDGQDSHSLVACDGGIYRITPPGQADGEWDCVKIYDGAVSDMCMVDLDKDGDMEMIAISPFHGNTVEVLKLVDGVYQKIQTLTADAEFGHSIWGGTVCGGPAAFVGHRKGARNLLGITYENGYHMEVLDSDVGSANVLKYDYRGGEYLVSANREINEIAFYAIEKQ